MWLYIVWIPDQLFTLSLSDYQENYFIIINPSKEDTITTVVIATTVIGALITVDQTAEAVTTAATIVVDSMAVSTDAVTGKTAVVVGTGAVSAVEPAITRPSPKGYLDPYLETCKFGVDRSNGREIFDKFPYQIDSIEIL